MAIYITCTRRYKELNSHPASAEGVLQACGELELDVDIDVDIAPANLHGAESPSSRRQDDRGSWHASTAYVSNDGGGTVEGCPMSSRGGSKSVKLVFSKLWFSVFASCQGPTHRTLPTK